MDEEYITVSGFNWGLAPMLPTECNSLGIQVALNYVCLPDASVETKQCLQVYITYSVNGVLNVDAVPILW